jgi:Zn-finger domain-containing protein
LYAPRWDIYRHYRTVSSLIVNREESEKIIYCEAILPYSKIKNNKNKFYKAEIKAE